MHADAPFLADAPVLVLSPHLDDVALSCAALVERGAPLTVLDVCTAGPSPAVAGDWDRRIGFADSDAAVAARRAEERAAFAGTPHRLVDLGLLDAQYGAGLDDDGCERLRTAIAEWLDAAGPGATVVVPVGAGCDPKGLVLGARLRALVRREQRFPRHEDHVGVRDAALALLASRPDATIALYEEQPYRSSGRGDAPAEAAARALGARLVRHDVPVDRAAKARRLGAYASQLPQLFPARASGARLAAHLPADERYWLLDRG